MEFCVGVTATLAANVPGANRLKFTPDGNHTVFANLDGPGAAITFDREGNLFIPFQWAGRIDKFTPDGSQRSVFATDSPQPV